MRMWGHHVQVYLPPWFSVHSWHGIDSADSCGRGSFRGDGCREAGWRHFPSGLPLCLASQASARGGWSHTYSSYSGTKAGMRFANRRKKVKPAIVPWTFPSKRHLKIVFGLRSGQGSSRPGISDNESGTSHQLLSMQTSLSSLSGRTLSCVLCPWGSRWWVVFKMGPLSGHHSDGLFQGNTGAMWHVQRNGK